MAHQACYLDDDNKTGKRRSATWRLEKLKLKSTLLDSVDLFLFPRWRTQKLLTPHNTTSTHFVSSALAICNKMEVNSQSSSPSPSLLTIDDPQCNLVVDGIDNLNLGGGDQEVESVANLQSISDDVLLNILLYCGSTDVEENLKFVNRRFQ